jgi:hypothetical protein
MGVQAAKEALDNGQPLPQKPLPAPISGKVAPRKPASAPVSTARAAAPRTIAAVGRTPSAKLMAPSPANLSGTLQRVSQGLTRGDAHQLAARPLGPPQVQPKPSQQGQPVPSTGGAVPLRPSMPKMQAAAPPAGSSGPASTAQFRPRVVPGGLPPTRGVGSTGPGAVNPEFARGGPSRTPDEAVDVARRLLNQFDAHKAQQR